MVWYRVQAKVNRNTSYVNRNRLYQFAFHLGQQWLYNAGVPNKKRVSSSLFLNSLTWLETFFASNSLDIKV